jgi:excinuclease UvrABC ATPase subunit
MYPYQIEQEVNYRDMRFWNDLSMSSIYKLLAILESKGLVVRANEVSPENRVRKLYSISEEGARALQSKLKELLSDPEHERWQTYYGQKRAIPTGDCISIIGAKEHNLKNVDVDIPKGRMVVFTGVSGSGKSSLVFDTIYAEAQRQLIETFSAFSRRYMPRIPKPNVDGIRNLSPVIRIDQKRMGENRRSTIGTATEISTYLRLLYSRCGTPFIGPSFYFSFNNPEGMSPECGGVGIKLEADPELLLDMEKSMAEGGIRHPFYQPGNIYYKIYRASGLFDVNKPLKEFTKEELDKLLYMEPVKIGEDKLGGVINATMEGVVTGIMRRQAGKEDIPERDLQFFKVATCKACHGTRINERARSVTLNGKNIAELSSMELIELREFFSGVSGPVAEPILAPIRWRMDQLIDIGSGYLSLDRPVGTLSGGESQRVKMAKQLTCDLVSMTYVFDEPSVGMHPRDMHRGGDAAAAPR